MRFDLVVNNLTAWAFTTGQVYLKSDGTPWRPLVHVEDIARAYIAALEAPRETVHNQAFNVGTTTENYQIRELAEIVHGRRAQLRDRVSPRTPGPDKRCYRVDCNRIARDLHGFKPQWTVRRGVEQLLRGLQAGRPDPGGVRGRALQAHRPREASWSDDGLLDDDLRWTQRRRTGS